MLSHLQMLLNLTHWAINAVKVSLNNFCPATVIGSHDFLGEEELQIVQKSLKLFAQGTKVLSRT